MLGRFVLWENRAAMTTMQLHSKMVEILAAHNKHIVNILY